MAIVQLVRDWRAAFAAWWIFALLIVPVFAVGAVIVRLDRRTAKSQAAVDLDHQSRMATWQQKVGELQARDGVDSMEAALPTQKEAIEKLLLERAKQMIVGAINKRLTPSYDARLDIRKPRGVFEPGSAATSSCAAAEVVMTGSCASARAFGHQVITST